MAEGSLPGVWMPDEDWFLQLWLDHREWLAVLEKDPTPLEEWIESRGKMLLGKRFEAFLQFFFSHSPHFEILKHGLLFSENNRTIGEVDFILHHLPSGEHWHLETACKYYIGKNNRNAWNDWWGPNGKDRLDFKLNKLRIQSKLMQTPAGEAVRAEHHWPPLRKAVWMKGYFFHAFHLLGRHRSPENAHPHYCSGWFVPSSELNRFAGTYPQWLLLPKERWMSPFHFSAEWFTPLSGDEMKEEVLATLQRTRKAVLLVQVEEVDGYLEEVSRGFVMA